MSETDQKAKDILARMERDRGTVIMQPWRSILSQRDPEFMERWHELIMYTLIKERALSRQVKEIIAIVMDAMTGYEEGLRIHTRLALEVGVTEEEILEALEVASLLGLHNISIPLPAAMEECDNFKKS
jgi:AhpD family alkylhydroperoxidase